MYLNINVIRYVFQSSKQIQEVLHLENLPLRICTPLLASPAERALHYFCQSFCFFLFYQIREHIIIGRALSVHWESHSHSSTNIGMWTGEGRFMGPGTRLVITSGPGSMPRELIYANTAFQPQRQDSKLL